MTKKALELINKIENLPSSDLSYHNLNLKYISNQKNDIWELEYTLIAPDYQKTIKLSTSNQYYDTLEQMLEILLNQIK